MHGVFTGYGYDDYGGASNNNTEEEDVTTEGYVRLNKALIGAGLKSLLPEDVVPFLTNELGWRVQKTSGEVITPETNFLEVMVVSVTLERSAETGFPKPLGPPMQYPECTAGRPGGCSNP
ncbi:hypothetical protein FRC03_005023 [Tulasnella sp. 419]|nr:hypothetical protein FRC03_005023 [Tulasnella sp. 419]